MSNDLTKDGGNGNFYNDFFKYMGFRINGDIEYCWRCTHSNFIRKISVLRIAYHDNVIASSYSLNSKFSFTWGSYCFYKHRIFGS